MITNKRYSVFISSTFEDLREERRAVQDTVINSGDFPVQMESFPAADEDQFEFIKSLIDTCDFYILIVAGRYGSIAEGGVSYTEKEYRYAVSKNIPVLVLLRSNIGELTVDKSEQTDEGKERLQKFREEVQIGRMRKIWASPDELKAVAGDALKHAKLTKNAIGWVRGDTIAQLETLEDVNRLQKENTAYREKIGDLKIELAFPEIPNADEKVVLTLEPTHRVEREQIVGTGSTAKIQTTWLNAFQEFHTNLDWRFYPYDGDDCFSIDMEESCRQIGSAIAAELTTFETTGLFRLSKNSFLRLQAYYQEIGLMEEEGDEPFSGSGNTLARKQLIIGAEGNYKLIEGKIAKTEAGGYGGFDDEIPF